MTGEIDFLKIAVFVVAVVAFVTDLRMRKIYNALTFPAMAVGLAAGALLGGSTGFTQSFLGLALGFVLYSWMYAIQVMGAGDVKLLMAFGALGGASFVFDVAIVAILLGGLFALALLISQKKFGAFWRKIELFFLSVRHRELGLPKPELDRRLKMPFGIALSVAAVWVAVKNPLQDWGWKPWS